MSCGMIFSVILVSTALHLCSGQELKETEDNDKGVFVKISKRPRFAGLNRKSNLEAEHNISSLSKFLPQLRSSPPKQYDWRVNYKFNVVPEAENQLPCETCWIFSTLYMLETQYAIHNNGRLVSLSKQQIVDCLKGPLHEGGCHGWGSPQLIFDYVKQNGLQGTKSYGPYLGKDGVCHRNAEKNILSVKGKLETFSGHEAFLQVIYHQGPIIATMITPTTYAGGIMRIRGDQCPDRTKISHSVLLVGYGVTQDGLKYWIAKNTYGTEFGIERGYFKIERGRNTLCIEDYGAIAKVVV